MTTGADFDVTGDDPSGVPVLNVHGEIDVATSPELNERLSTLIEDRPIFVIVNLSDVSFIDSTGLGVLVGAVKQARAAGGDVRLVVTRPQTLRLFELTGLDEVFSIMSSTTDAVSS